MNIYLSKLIPKDRYVCIMINKKCHYLMKRIDDERSFLIPLDHITANEFKTYDRIIAKVLIKDDHFYNEKYVYFHLPHNKDKRFILKELKINDLKSINTLIDFISLGNKMTMNIKKEYIKELLRKKAF